MIVCIYHNGYSNITLNKSYNYVYMEGGYWLKDDNGDVKKLSERREYFIDNNQNKFKFLTEIRNEKIDIIIDEKIKNN